MFVPLYILIPLGVAAITFVVIIVALLLATLDSFKGLWR